MVIVFLAALGGFLALLQCLEPSMTKARMTVGPIRRRSLVDSSELEQRSDAGRSDAHRPDMS